MPFCFFILYVILPTVQLIAFGSCCFQIYGFLMSCDGMPDGVLRVRAAPDKRHRDRPAQGKSLKRIVFYLLFPAPLHPVNSDRALHDRE
jgi:hypothetical protein